ncbi:MAG: cytochrome b N-terminal domain-containing protein [Scytolyngbya sp. HA4215-MV1]|jgi:cytochrome b6|nr:cytochrome b N-terminal domain-containing protein [Scytolyngbya sp. HA4215-MV1]
MKAQEITFSLRRTSTILAVSVLTLTLVAALTGILLAFYYEPTAGGSYNSLRFMTTVIPNGWLFRSIHDIAGNLVIVVALIQLVVMFFGERFRRSWLTAWISGIVFITIAMGLGWTAMILDWSQVGFWRLKIELGIIESIPFAGTALRDILTGGGALNTLTVARMFTLHSYILSIVAVILSIVHLASLVWQEREVKSEALDSTAAPTADSLSTALSDASNA